MKHTILPLHLAAAVVAVSMSACESSTIRISPTASSLSPVVSATLHPSTGPSQQAFTGFMCSSPPTVVVASSPFFLAAPRFDIVVVASQTVDLSHVTLQLIDGSHIGGPMVTFPQPQLNSTFGSTRIAAGHTRTFGIHPDFGCSDHTPTAVAANLVFVDLGGSMHTTSISAPLQ